MKSAEKLFHIEGVRDEARRVQPVHLRGRVLELAGQSICAAMSGVAMRDIVRIRTRAGTPHRYLLAQVVGFQRGSCTLSPFRRPEHIVPGAEVELVPRSTQLVLGEHLLGNVVDSLGRVIDSRGIPQPAQLSNTRSLSARSASTCPALDREPIDEPFCTGLRAIDGFLTVGYGQRLGVFAPPGAGKSTLLAHLARHSAADINVVALIGERGREVKELLTDGLDSETMKKTVFVVSTSDEAAVSRINAAETAMEIAEYFRDTGLDVLLQIDSLSRLARAYREAGLAAGEPPVRHGYPPSVFAELPRLIERAGSWSHGSITAFFTVLTSDDSLEDPIAEEIQSLTDGHIVLSSDLAERGVYPAIDLVSSLSRLHSRVGSKDAVAAARFLKGLLSRARRDGDLALVGGSVDAELRAGFEAQRLLARALRQGVAEESTLEEARRSVLEVASNIATQLEEAESARAEPQFSAAPHPSTRAQPSVGRTTQTRPAAHPSTATSRPSPRPPELSRNIADAIEQSTELL
ncbi:MAG: FliI/YscN family ATPase [Deltaproteobacteria bacterium]|nr:FliI/YscN family ATPase [Deltaproteobacteria bacterium]